MPHFKQRGNDVVVFDDNDNEIIVFSSDGKVYFGDLQDVNLYRIQASRLKTDGSVTAVGGFGVAAPTVNDLALEVWAGADVNDHFILYGDGKAWWGDGTNSPDTNLYRTAAGMLKTDTGLTVGTQLKLGVYTTAGRPSATGLAGTLIYVSDASAGQKLQYSDGSSWVAAG